MDDTERDVLALLRAVIARDQDGIGAILAGADPVPLILALCDMTVEALHATATEMGIPDPRILPAVDGYLRAALQDT